LVAHRAVNTDAPRNTDALRVVVLLLSDLKATRVANQVARPENRTVVEQPTLQQTAIQCAAVRGQH
jgi:hypothetical protein